MKDDPMGNQGGRSIDAPYFGDKDSICSCV